MLLKHYSQKLLKEDSQKPILWAARNGYHNTVTDLIVTGRGNVDEISECKNSPLLWASRHGFTEIARVLIKHLASVKFQDILEKYCADKYCKVWKFGNC